MHSRGCRRAPARARRPGAVAALSVGLTLLGAGAAQAQLRLPEKTVVVRDFARKRQDLLDTLRVNVPDADVAIAQFRGGHVVLEVTYRAPVAPDQRAAARRQLEEHCDALVRRAFPGMRLSPESRFDFQERRPEEELENGYSDRIRKAMAALRQKAEGEPDEDEAGGSSAEAPSGEGSEADGFRMALARERGVEPPEGDSRSTPADEGREAASGPRSPTPPGDPGEAAARRAEGAAALNSLLSPETALAIAQHPAVAAPRARGVARRHLSHRAERKALMNQLEASPGVSPDTLAAIQRFRPEVKDSYKTVREIYGSIYKTREQGRRALARGEEVALTAPILTGDEKALAEDATRTVRLPEPIMTGNPSGEATLPGRPPRLAPEALPGAPPAASTLAADLDTTLGDRLTALLRRRPRPPASRLGRSVVTSRASEAARTQEEVP